MARRNETAAVLGTVASALAIASCCIGPVLFLIFGTTVGALSSLAVLEPYRPYFIGVGLTSWGYAFYGLYLRKPAGGGSCGEACERPSRAGRALLWLSLGVFAAAILLPRIALYYAD